MNNCEKKTWNDLSFKDRISYIIAIVSFIFGWVVTLFGVLTPPVGEAHDSILFILGQSLVFTGSILGFGMYITSTAKGLKDRLEYRLDDIEKAQLERERLRYSDNIDDVPYEK